MKINKELCLLYNYLNQSDEKNEIYYDLLRYTFDQRIYYYGANFNKPYERHVSLYEKTKNKLISIGIDLYVFIKSKTQKPSEKTKIWSTAYFNISEKINDNKYIISRPPWAYSKGGNDLYDFELYLKVKAIKIELETSDVSNLITAHFFEKIDALKESVKQYVLKENIKAIFLPHDLGFFEKLAIQIFKEIDRPSFLLIHGLPGIYSKIDNNRTDYLIVWGKAIKQHYIDIGYSPEKIIVNGHPKYSLINNGELKFTFENILVLPRSVPGAPIGDEYKLSDRGNSIYYMLAVQNTLKKFGISKVRFRPHPSESINWYLKFLDRGFFIPDTDSLSNSLKKSSLVIGPTSTVFLEALIMGVNYMVFEPKFENGKGMDTYSVVPPFDGSDEKVPCASTDTELYEILKSGKKINLSVLEDYIEPNFEPSLVLNLVK